ncbi:cellulose binding domain-containing protein [Glycomyces sp. NPDC046736]|uniref:cellulose binding domain-containing protein n=1 Tax=Glycomyces sp. NPDC046736 TaxID=3155615 RepID=UPI0034070BEC
MLQGRLHGRLLKVLLVVAALVSMAAVLQFTLLREDAPPVLADLGQSERASAAPEASEASSEADSPSVSTSPTPSPTAEATTSDAASTAASTPEAPNSAESSAAPVTEAAPDPLQCTAALSLSDQWGSTVVVRVAIANSGTETLSGWEVVIDVPGLDVTSTWGLAHIEGDRYGDIFFNAAVAPGESVEPTFFADLEGELSLPATVPCSAE